jgi:hypothetical protein
MNIFFSKKNYSLNLDFKFFNSLTNNINYIITTF